MEELKTSLNLDILTQPDNSSSDDGAVEMYENAGIDITAEISKSISNPEQKTVESEVKEETSNPTEDSDFIEEDHSIDLTEQFAKNLNKDNQEKKEDKQEKSSDAYTVKDLLSDAFKSKFGDDFSLPEDISDENWFDKTIELIQSKIDTKSNLHPLAKEIQQAAENNIDVDSIVKAYVDTKGSYQSMNDKELVRNELKEVFGNKWSEEKINNVLANLEKSGQLEIEAEKIRIVSEKRAEEKMKYESERQKAERLKAQQEMQAEIDRRISDVSSKFEKNEEVFGIQVGKAEKLEFLKEFPNLVKPDPKTGVSWMERQLQSDENAIKVAFILKYGDKLVKSALTSAKEQAKGSIIDRLDPEPRLPKRSDGEQHDPLVIDFDALVKPEKIYIKRK